MNSKKFLDQLGLIALISKIKQALNGKQNVDMVVTITQSGNAYSCDTSIANIVAAHDAGRDVYAVLPPVSDGSSTKIELVEVQNYGSGTVMMVSFGDIINNGTNNVLYSVSGTRQNNLDAWSVSQKTMQEKLVSGTSIKTVNGNTLLGSGDVTINGSERVTATWDASASAYTYESAVDVDTMYQSFYSQGKVLELHLVNGNYNGLVLTCHGGYTSNNERHLKFSGSGDGKLIEADVVGTAVTVSYKDINAISGALYGKQDTIGLNNKVDADFVEYRGADTSRLGNGDSMTEALQTLDNAITNLGTPNEIASITTQESSASGGNNVVTITDTDGTNTSFNVKNGKDGKDGADGADGVSLGEIALVQTTGDATDEVMSQKAVTERVERVSEEEIPNLGGVNRLPYGYLELAWIDNGDATHKQGAYIDTGLLPDDANWRFVGSWARAGTFAVGFPIIIGTAGNTGMNCYLLQAASSLITHIYPLAYQKVETRTILQLKNSAINVWHDFDLKVGELVLDGTTVALGTDSSGTAITTTMKLGSQYYPLMLGEFKAFHNDSLVADLIPCKRQSDNTIGMYDIVRDQFFASANAYDFIGGDVIGGGADKLINGNIMSKLVVQDTGTSVYKTMSQASITRKVERLGTSELSLFEMSYKLPAGYTMVDYIDNVGMAYITTDIYLSTTDCRIVGKWKRTGGITAANAVIVSKNNLAGNLAGYSLRYPTTSGGSVKVNGGSRIANGSVITLDEDLDVWHTYDLSHGTLVLDGVSYDIDTTTASASNNPMQICSTYLAMQVGLTKFYKGDKLIGLFIPCISDTEEVGMYDAVSGVFYGSKTSVGFEAGHEVTQLHDRLINGEYLSGKIAQNVGYDDAKMMSQAAITREIEVAAHRFDTFVHVGGCLCYFALDDYPQFDPRECEGISVVFDGDMRGFGDNTNAPYFVISNGNSISTTNPAYAITQGWATIYGGMVQAYNAVNNGCAAKANQSVYAHMAITLNFKTGEMVLYKNGVLTNSVTPANYDEEYVREKLASFTHMGLMRPTGTTYYQYTCAGMAMFGHILTQAEVTEIYGGGNESTKGDILPQSYYGYQTPPHIVPIYTLKGHNSTQNYTFTKDAESGDFTITMKADKTYLNFALEISTNEKFSGRCKREFNFTIESGTMKYTNTQYNGANYKVLIVTDSNGNDVTDETLETGTYHASCIPTLIKSPKEDTQLQMEHKWTVATGTVVRIHSDYKLTDLGAALVCSRNNYRGIYWEQHDGTKLPTSTVAKYSTLPTTPFYDIYKPDTLIYKSSVLPQFNGQIAVDSANGKVYIGYLTGTGGTWKQVSN